MASLSFLKRSLSIPGRLLRLLSPTLAKELCSVDSTSNSVSHRLLLFRCCHSPLLPWLRVLTLNHRTHCREAIWRAQPLLDFSSPVPLAGWIEHGWGEGGKHVNTDNVP